MPREVGNPLLERYTAGRAQFRPIPEEEEPIDLIGGGINTLVHPERIEGGQSPKSDDVRLTDSGLSSESGHVIIGTAYSGAEDKNILAVREFQRVSGAKEYLVRMRATGWDRWDGTAWLTLSGALAGSPSVRPYTALMKNRILGANGTDRIKSWDGNDGSAVADLSADAPRAKYIVPFGTRLVAAYINPGGATDPYRVQWSADGNITNWTDPNLGAGTGIIEPEGQHRGFADFFTGLAALETAMVLYRQSSIMVGLRTGVGVAPFRFYTPIHGLGTLSPHSVVTVGRQTGVIFLGNDLNVYLYDGQNQPQVIGDFIHRSLRTALAGQDPEDVVGGQNSLLREFWLGIPTSPGGQIHEAWVLSLRDLLGSRRIIWHKRALPVGTKTLGFGFKTTGTDPIVDSVLTIVNNTTCIVDACGARATSRHILFGNNIGEVRAFDFLTFIGGKWHSKAFGMVDGDTTVDRVYGRFDGRVAGQLKIAVSFDGGATVVAERTVNYGVGSNTFSTWHEVTGRAWQVRVELVSGDLTISDLKATVKPRGRLTSAA